MKYKLKVREYCTYLEYNYYEVEADSIEEACTKYYNEDSGLINTISQEWSDTSDGSILEIYDDNNNILQKNDLRN